MKHFFGLLLFLSVFDSTTTNRTKRSGKRFHPYKNQTQSPLHPLFEKEKALLQLLLSQSQQEYKDDIKIYITTERMPRTFRTQLVEKGIIADSLSESVRQLEEKIRAL